MQSRLLLAVAVLIALPIRALVSPCDIPTVMPTETRANIGDVLLFDGAQPRGQCSFEFKTSTPSVIAVDGYEKIPSGFRVFVHALAPGDGILVVHGFLPGATEYSHTAATIHVDGSTPCAPGAYGLKLQPLYTASVNAPIRIDAEVSGTFNRGLLWFVNGMAVAEGPSLTYTPPGAGVYAIALVGDSSFCGRFEVRTTLNVVAETPRLRSVRRR